MEFVSNNVFNPTELDKEVRKTQLAFADCLERNDIAGLEQILTTCFKSLALLGKVLYPERFRLPFTKQHMRAFEVLDDSSLKKVVVAAHRGFGKTSIVSLLLMSRNILYRISRFIPYISKTETHAIMQTENLKRSLLSSHIVRALFGSIKTRKFVDMDESFSKKSWVASLPGDDQFQTLVLPRGEGQRIRGVLFNHYRPDLIQVDDFEDEEYIGTELYRNKVREEFYGSIMESVSQAEEKGVNSRIIYTDTVKHHSALIEELLTSSDWVGLRLAACDDDYKTLVPGFIPTNVIKEKADAYREKNQLDVFAREFMCRPIAKESAAFNQDMFRRYSETDPWFREQVDQLRNVVILDPSRTISGNKAGLVCWGVNTQTNAMFLREARAEKWHPEQIIKEGFDTAIRYGAHIIGYEDTGLNEWISQPMRNEMIRRGLHFELIALKAKRFRRAADIVLNEDDGKPGRSGALLVFYRQGLIYHNVVGTSSYELSLLEWPRPKEWDIIDAAAYIVPIMDEYTIFFQNKDGGDNPYEYNDEFSGIVDYGDNVENEALANFI